MLRIGASEMLRIGLLDYLAYTSDTGPVPQGRDRGRDRAQSRHSHMVIPQNTDACAHVPAFDGTRNSEHSSLLSSDPTCIQIKYPLLFRTVEVSSIPNSKQGERRPQRQARKGMTAVTTVHG